MPLTTQDVMLQDSRQAGAQIEITPAMIEAGAFALADFDRDSETVSDGAQRIFRVMVMAALACSSAAN